MKNCIRNLFLAVGLLAIPAIVSAQYPTAATATISTAGSDCSTSTNCAVFAVRGVPSIGINLQIGVSGTFVYEATTATDPNTTKNWFAINDDVNSAGSTTSSGQLFFTNPGYSYIRIRASAISGAASLTSIAGGSGLRSTATLSATISGTNPAASTTGSAVPASASYTGLNIGGNLTGQTGVSVGTAKAGAVAIVDGSGNQITSFGGGTQYTTGSAQATPTGTVSFGWDGTTVRAASSDTSGHFQVVFPSAQHTICDSGCSSSTAPADESTFTAGTTSQTPIGGFFQTTATSNPLTTGQMGAFQVTANRALFVNLRTSAGAEIGVGGSPIRVDPTGTTAQPVTGTFWQTTQPVSGTVTVTQATGTNLHTVCDSGCSSSTAPADRSTFTYGTTSQTPIGGVFNSAITALTSGQMGAVALDSFRSVHVINYDASGNVVPNTTTGAGATDSTTPRSVTASDSPDVTALGATSDAASSGAASINAHLRFIAGTGVPVTSLPSTPAGSNIIGKVSIDQTTPGTTNAVAIMGSTPVFKAALSTTVTQVVTGAHVLTMVSCANANQTATNFAYIQIFDVSTAGGVTLGTTAPTQSYFVPANNPGGGTGLHLSFANGIQVAATTTASGSSAPATALDCSFGYR